MQIKQTPIAFLRAMGNIAWSAFRHPLKTTLIDLETGKIIGCYTREELERLNSETNNMDTPISSSNSPIL